MSPELKALSIALRYSHSEEARRAYRARILKMTEGRELTREEQQVRERSKASARQTACTNL